MQASVLALIRSRSAALSRSTSFQLLSILRLPTLTTVFRATHLTGLSISDKGDVHDTVSCKNPLFGRAAPAANFCMVSDRHDNRHRTQWPERPEVRSRWRALRQEAGTGGTATPCEVVPTVGPYHGGPTATVSRIAPDGGRTTVVSGLASALSSLPSGDTLGASDVAFLGDKLYVLVAGDGCSHGNPDAPAGIVRVDIHKGTWDYIADLSEYLRDNPVENPNLDDFEPDGVHSIALVCYAIARLAAVTLLFLNSISSTAF